MAESLERAEALDPVARPPPSLRRGDEFEALVEDRVAYVPGGDVVHEHLLVAADPDHLVHGELGQDRPSERVLVHRSLGLERALVVPQGEKHELLIGMQTVSVTSHLPHPLLYSRGRSSASREISSRRTGG